MSGRVCMRVCMRVYIRKWIVVFVLVLNEPHLMLPLVQHRPTQVAFIDIRLPARVRAFPCLGAWTRAYV